MVDVPQKLKFEVIGWFCQFWYTKTAASTLIFMGSVIGSPRQVPEVWYPWIKGWLAIEIPVIAPVPLIKPWRVALGVQICCVSKKQSSVILILYFPQSFWIH